jgi:hypothetical protein
MDAERAVQSDGKSLRKHTVLYLRTLMVDFSIRSMLGYMSLCEIKETLESMPFQMHFYYFPTHIAIFHLFQTHIGLFSAEYEMGL